VGLALAALLSPLVGALAGPCLAAGARHPPVAADGPCVTRECHVRLLEPAGPSRDPSSHQPAADGDCVSCHDLSLPAQARFVKGAPAGAADGPESARAWDLALCAGCHGDRLYARDAPPGSTRFADGKKNLHTLHVQAGRGRRCLTCHEPHAARQPLLLRERIPSRGSVKIAQEFRSEPGGGWCRTGCHAPKDYRR
jgi:predicted CXXCH cytochrome family protein